MTKSSKSGSFQSLGGGTYRVTGVRRSALTGRYVTGNKTQASSTARQNPQPTTKRTK